MTGNPNKLSQFWQKLDTCLFRAIIYVVCFAAMLLLNPTSIFSQESSDSLINKLSNQTKIAFTAEREGNFDIYVMNADGSRQKRLTNNPDWDEQPRWSPDGKKFAYMSIVNDEIDDRHWEVFVMNADGSDQKRLTYSKKAASPSWSPDGEKIAFSGDRGDGNSAIFIMDADGSQQTILTDRGGRPSWSGNGQQIAFISWTDESSDISIINSDGTGETNLTNSPAMDGTPSFSPDGRKIAFLSIVDNNYDIYVMNADGTEQKRLTDNPAVVIAPSWSPDGNMIIFERGVSEEDFDLYIMNPDGSEQKRLIYNSGYDGHAAWSPYLTTNE